MHTTAIRSAHALGIFNDRTPSRWRTCLRSILSRSWFRKNEEAEHNSMYRLDERLFADVGLYREHGIHSPENRVDHNRRSPVPAELLALWMTRI